MWKFVKGYFVNFRALGRLPREFWGVQALNLIFMWVYFVFVTIATLHLTQDIGFSDSTTGLLMACFVLGSAILMLVMGPIMDLLGYRKTGLLATLIMAVGMFGIGATPFIFGAGQTTKVVCLIFYAIAVIGSELLLPVVMAGTKRYSSPETEKLVYIIWYLTLNLGLVLVVILDLLRRALGVRDLKPTLEQIDSFRKAGGNSHVMYVLGLASLLCTLIVYLLIRKDSTHNSPEEQQKPTFRQIVNSVFGDKKFRKAFIFMLLTTPAYIPTVSVYVLYPKYWTRVLSADASLGGYQALNPIIIIIGLALFLSTIKKFNLYWLLTMGFLICGTSMAVLAIPPSWLMGTLGITLDQSYYLRVVTQICLFALGEMVWTPQMMTYVASVSSAGNEGTIMGLGRIPHTLAKLGAALVSGYLLQRYCPEGIKLSMVEGKLSYWNSPEFMFLLVTLVCLSCPIIMLVKKNYFFVTAKANDHE